MPKLSVTVITRNESASLARALESVAWADELIVVDSHSSDDTVEIARRFTDRVTVRDWEGYAAQKNHAAGLARNDWILSVDADERVSEGLGQEIRTALSGEPRARGYRIPRVTHYLGRWIRTTDWYPDYQLRLYDRRAARWEPRLVHESVGVDGAVERLSNELEHFAYRDISHHLQTIDRYTTLAARHLHDQGGRSGALRLCVHPVFAFGRNYLLRAGLRDGVPGLIVSALNSYYVFLKYAKLWELERYGHASDRRPQPPITDH